MNAADTCSQLASSCKGSAEHFRTRVSVLSFLKQLVEHNFLGVTVICCGSVATGTYLLSSDMDMTVVIPPDLIALSAGTGNCLLKLMHYFTTFQHDQKRFDAHDLPPEQFIITSTAYLPPLLRVTVNGIPVDITINRLNAIAASAVTCKLLGCCPAGVLKQSFTLLKLWATREAGKYVGRSVIGSPNGMLPPYAWFVMCVPIAATMGSDAIVADFMAAFFEYYSTFDWTKNALTMQGPVELATIGRQVDSTQQVGAAPQVDANSTTRNIGWIAGIFSNFGHAAGTQRQWIQHSGANIVDPVDAGNNLGLSMSGGNLVLLTKAFVMAKKHLKVLTEWEEIGFDEKKVAPPWKLSSLFPFMWPVLEHPSSTHEDWTAFDTSAFAKRTTAKSESAPKTCNYCGCHAKDMSEHVRAKHSFSVSFFPSCLEYLTTEVAEYTDAALQTPPASPKSRAVTQGTQGGALSVAIPEDEPNAALPDTPTTPIALFRANSNSKPITPQQGRSKSHLRSSSSSSLSVEVQASDLHVSFGMVSHACRLAGVHKAMGVEEGDEKKRRNRRGKRNSRARGRSRAGSESFDGSLDGSFESFDSLASDDFRVDFIKEQSQGNERDDKSKNDLLNDAMKKAAIREKTGGAAETKPVYEAYAARKTSVSDSPRESQQAPSRRLPSPMETTPEKSWANAVVPSHKQTCEFTLGDVVVRARTIDQGFHSAVAPGLGAAKKGMFGQAKRIMWVVCVNDRNFNVSLEHNTISGGKTLKVNDHTVATEGGSVMDFGGQFKFRLSQLEFAVSVEASLAGFKYKLFMSGLKSPILRV